MGLSSLKRALLSTAVLPRLEVVVGGNAGISLNVTVCGKQKQNLITRMHGSAKSRQQSNQFQYYMSHLESTLSGMSSWEQNIDDLAMPKEYIALANR
jgi:hypothetical protein